MARRQPLPRLWLFTDERLGEQLHAAVERLPRGGGIVFRQYSLALPERRLLFDALHRVALRRGLMLLLAGTAAQARAWGADGSHGRGRGTGFRSAPVHDLAEIRAAERAGANLLFLSPVFATRTHPEAVPLGPRRFSRLAHRTHLPVIALGGMSAERAQKMRALGAYGWAGIDAFA